MSVRIQMVRLYEWLVSDSHVGWGHMSVLTQAMRLYECPDSNVGYHMSAVTQVVESFF